MPSKPRRQHHHGDQHPGTASTMDDDSDEGDQTFVEVVVLGPDHPFQQNRSESSWLVADGG